jgi:putative transcriptional regulator
MTAVGSKNRVKLARIENDLTQAQLAEKAEVTRQTIGLIEAGRFNPSLKLCTAIAQALNRTLDDLFWMEEEDEHDQG